MEIEIAKKHLQTIREHKGLLERCIEHATINRKAFDERSTAILHYNEILKELEREEADYRDIIKYG